MVALQRLELFLPPATFSAGLMDPVSNARSCDQQNSCLQLLLSLNFVFLCAMLLEFRDEQAVNSLKMYILRKEFKLVDT